jgi:flagellar FliL protein
MAENDDEDEGEEKDGDGGGEIEQGKKKPLIIFGVCLMLFVGGMATAYFTGLLDPLVEMAVGSPETPPKGSVVLQTLGGDAVLADLLAGFQTTDIASGQTGESKSH